VVHEYHYPGGPLTYEYPLGSRIPPAHLDCLSDFVRDLAGLNPGAIRQRLAADWSTLDASIALLAEYLLSLEICSVAFTEGETSPRGSWLVLRGPDPQQCLLGSAPPMSAELSGAKWINQHVGLRQLLAHFGALQVGMIPPCAGFYVSKCLIHENDNKLCWGRTGPWENGLPIFHGGSGNSICVSARGAIAIWSPQGFQYVAPALGDFVQMLVRRERSGQSAPGEWWW
jgi:hypothetical protein